MAKKQAQHPSSKYSHPSSFDRLMLLISTLVKYPGVGYLGSSAHSDGKHHNALEEVQAYLQSVAQSYKVNLPTCSTHTIHKDLANLRSYGILGDQMYRWGYYLGTGAMSEAELKVCLNALHSQAEYQRDLQAKRVYEQLTKRLRGVDSQGEFFYPVRAQLNRSIVETDPSEATKRMDNPRNLFDCIETVEEAILQRQKIEIYRHSDPFESKEVGVLQVWPLQLLHYDIAWYLIYERCDNHHLAISRVDRFKDHCQVINPKSRSWTAQRKSLQLAHELLENGWGLYLGNYQEQRQELMGQLAFAELTVRFFPKVITFITEGSLRHRNQNIKLGPKDSLGKVTYADYTVKLPPRSIKEFSFWVYRFMGNAQVISPEWLVEEHRRSAEKQYSLYNNAS